jgi:hypothetical protein
MAEWFLQATNQPNKETPNEMCRGTDLTNKLNTI